MDYFLPNLKEIDPSRLTAWDLKQLAHYISELRQENDHLKDQLRKLNQLQPDY